MLKDLKILNGILDLEYDEYIYEYTITVEDSVNALDILYEIDKGCNIRVRNNSLLNKENIVYIDVYNNINSITYTLYVYKESVEEVSSIDNYLSSLEINKNEIIPIYKVQVLSISIFLIILIFFSIIFKRNIKKKIK